MTDLIQRIDAEIERRSLLKHPFYRMWSEGKLTFEQLGGYAKEYFQLVKRIPMLVENVRARTPSSQLEAQISENLREEKEHIEPWSQFAGALGIRRSELETYDGTCDTSAAVSDLDQLTKLPFEKAVAAMYAYESKLPEISRSKINGLKEFYGLENHDAINYFEIHETADIRHAAVWRSILASTAKENENAVISAVIHSMEAQNRLLDSVLNRYCN